MQVAKNGRSLIPPPWEVSVALPVYYCMLFYGVVMCYTTDGSIIVNSHLLSVLPVESTGIREIW